jgi:cell pole-organizing protein PopZ
MEDILASIRRILSEDEAQTSPASVAHGNSAHPQGGHQPPDVLALDSSMLVEDTAPTGSALFRPAPAPPRPSERDVAPPAVAASPQPVQSQPPPPQSMPLRHEMPFPEPVRPEPARQEPGWPERSRPEAGIPSGLSSAHFGPPPSAPIPGPFGSGVTTSANPPTAAAPAPFLAAESPASPPPQPARKPVEADALVAPEAAAAAATSMGSLLRKLAAERHTPVFRNGPTLEDLVRDEMRPMLKEWLDTHLPALVERLVRAEIDRVNNALR